MHGSVFALALGIGFADGLRLYLLALGIGLVAGLRTFTAPAVVAWAAHLGRLHLHGSPFAFMGTTATAVTFSLLALFEYGYDLSPIARRRTEPGSLIARIVSGGLCGACLFASAGQSWIAGALLGGAGGVIGAFAGYHTRKRLVEALKVKDAMIAIPEDLVAIGLAYLIAIS
jgi:uncharacterized membrane protein